MTFISADARCGSTPLFTILGKDVMREEVDLSIEPSEAAQKSIDKTYPDGRPNNWADCYRISEVSKTIVPAIGDNFISNNNLQVTEQDIVDYISRVEVVVTLPGSNIVITNDLDAETRQMMEASAPFQLSSWKYYTALYNKYGGRIGTTEYGDIIPMDAFIELFKESERQGVFTIHDNELRDLFWTCITNAPITYLSDDEGRKALYKHPADVFNAIVDENMSNVMSRTTALIESRKNNVDSVESQENSEPAPPAGRGEAPRP